MRGHDDLSDAAETWEAIVGDETCVAFDALNVDVVQPGRRIFSFTS